MGNISLNKAEISDARQITDVSWKNPGLVYRPISTIHNSIKSGRVIVLKDNTKTIGWIEMYAITKTVYGISTLYIAPEYRGRGLYTVLVRAALQRMKRFHIIMATSNPKIMRFLLKHRFVETNFISLPPYIIIRIIYMRYFNILSIWKYCTSAGNQIKIFYRI